MGALSLTFLLLPRSDQPEMGPRVVTQRDGTSYLICSVAAVPSFTQQTFSRLICKTLRTWCWKGGATAEVDGDSEGLAPVLMAFGAVKEVLPYYLLQGQTNAELCTRHQPQLSTYTCSSAHNNPKRNLLLSSCFTAGGGPDEFIWPRPQS